MIIGANVKKTFIYLFEKEKDFAFDMQHCLTNAFDIDVQYEYKVKSARNIEGELLYGNLKKYFITLKGKGEILSISSKEFCLISSYIIEPFEIDNRNALENCYFNQGDMPLIDDFSDNNADDKDGKFYVPVLNCLLCSKKISNDGWRLEFEEK